MNISIRACLNIYIGCIIVKLIDYFNFLCKINVFVTCKKIIYFSKSLLRLMEIFLSDELKIKCTKNCKGLFVFLLLCLKHNLNQFELSFDLYNTNVIKSYSKSDKSK